MKKFGFGILLTGCSLGVLAAEAPVAPRDPVKLDPKTETVIKGALKWLATKQQPNGAWGSTDMERQHPVAITGYALMAYQATGHLPAEGEFGKNVSLGLQYLLDNTTPDGLIGNKNNGQYMYGHGIAAIALAEMYGQTRSPAMKPKLDKIMRVIIGSQNNEGGWRYRPIAYQADISVTVLQVVALRAAKNSGLDVPQATIDNAVKYVKKCYHPATGGFSYQPGQSPGFARTAAAIYSLQVCGLYDDPMVKAGSKYLFEHQREARGEWWTYGNFYASPAQYMQGGDVWQKWYEGYKQTLLSKVTTHGDVSYWDPDEAQLDSGRRVGPVYSTAVYTMMLGMPNHYIPLYQR
jgi:hypothetical protein